MMVIDMHAPGVTVRPLKMPTGNSDFNEVFFDGVFVPDANVVGPVDGGWTVARATLGNESVSIGGGDGGRMTMPGRGVHRAARRAPGATGRRGRAGRQADLPHAGDGRAEPAQPPTGRWPGGGPGPEGNIAKLLLSELGHETAAIMAELAGPDAAFLAGDGAMAATLMLMNRAMSIAGGTSEIKRNQIAERISASPATRSSSRRPPGIATDAALTEGAEEIQLRRVAGYMFGYQQVAGYMFGYQAVRWRRPSGRW